MKYKVFVLLIYGIVHAGFAQSQVFERTEHESKTFKVYQETTLEVNNKYGNIHLFNWDKDSVKMDIDILVRASKESKTDKIFEYINLDFHNTKYYIIANTQLKQNQGSFWAEVSDLTNTIFSGNNKAQIDYNIYLPTSMDVKLTNKFGNIYMSDYSGNITINLSNGDYKANELKGETNINVSFGNAIVSGISKGNIELNYGEVDIEDAKNLSINSKSSTIRIKKSGVLKLSSKRDKFFIDEVRSVSGTASFSYLTFKSFQTDMEVVTDYGEVKIERIKSDFSLIDIKSKYTDIYMNLSTNTSCKIKINHNETTGIYYPDHYKNISKLVMDKKAGIYKTSGVIGDQTKAKGKISISTNSGKVVLKEQIQVF